MNKYALIIIILLLKQAAFAQQTHVVKVAVSDCEVLSIGNTDSTVDVEVYPNPTHQHLMIKHSYKKAEVTLFDPSGKQVLRAVVNKPLSEINVERLTGGLYLLQLKHQKGITQVKILLKR